MITTIRTPIKGHNINIVSLQACSFIQGSGSGSLLAAVYRVSPLPIAGGHVFGAGVATKALTTSEGLSHFSTDGREPPSSEYCY